MLIWRPIFAGKISLAEVKSGVADLNDILKLNALLDMEAATNHAMTAKT